MLRNQTRLFRPIAPVGSATTFRIGLHRALAAMVSVAFLASGMPIAQAADYYWDANGATGGTGGTGVWTTTNTWRQTSSAGTLGNWPNSGNNNAFFEGTAGQVSVGATPVTMGTGTAFFNVTGYALQTDAGTTTRTVTGNVTIGSALNLFINEAAATANRALSIAGTISGGTITLRWWTDEDGGQLSVTDTGPGIPAEHLPRLTERFYRVDPGRARDTGGSGLGLAIVRHVLQRHGGELAITSEEGRGSTFTCHFPPLRLVRQPVAMTGDSRYADGVGA